MYAARRGASQCAVPPRHEALRVNQEQLTSIKIGGRWHARYPTATKTLCGLDAPQEFQPGRKWPPDCGPCSRTARLFHRIDGSMPDHWLPHEAAA